MNEVEIRVRWIERAERLNLFIRERFGGNRSKFAIAAGIARTQVDDYAGPKNRTLTADDDWKMKNPGVEMMLNFMRAGLNIAWWISGYGSMDYVPEVEAGVDAGRQAMREEVLNVRRMLEEAKESVDKLLVAL